MNKNNIISQLDQGLLRSQNTHLVLESENGAHAPMMKRVGWDVTISQHRSETLPFLHPNIPGAMCHSIYAECYPACIKVGLDVRVGKRGLKLLVEDRLARTVMEVIPVPSGHAKKGLTLHIPSFGEEDDPHFGKWYQTNPRTGVVSYITPLSIRQTHPELFRGEGSIVQLLEARREVNELTDFSSRGTKIVRASKPRKTPYIGFHSRKVIIPASVQKLVTATLNRNSFSAAATTKVQVSVEDGMSPRKVALTPDHHGRIRLSDFKVEMGQIGLEVGDRCEQYLPRWSQWVPVLWDTRLAADSANRIVLRKLN
ncbi:hypothetical protein PM082_006435 [Marasmius tenuissimus]|nr:hypothetical protein PM082_006435 [Marasmius tenuissimus]